MPNAYLCHWLCNIPDSLTSDFQSLLGFNRAIMGHGFGELYKLRHIITYRLSPFEQRAFAGAISRGIPNMVRRVQESFLYVMPRKYIAFAI